MSKTSTAQFDRQYPTHLKHLKLKGLQPKTIVELGRPRFYAQSERAVVPQNARSPMHPGAVASDLVRWMLGPFAVARLHSRG